MERHNSITQMQLEQFNFIDNGLSIDGLVYIIDDFFLPVMLPFPFKLTFTSAIVCNQGEMTAVINQRKLIVKKGDVFIVQYGSIVESLMCSPDLKTISMAFAGTDDGRIFNRPAKELGNWLVHCSIPVSVHLNEIQLQRYQNLYIQIKELYKYTSVTLRNEIVKGFISISVASFLSIPQIQLNENIDSRQVTRYEEVFLHFMDDLQLFANKERSVKFYSDRLCISPKYFSKLISQASGKHPMEHIKQRVIIEAKTLLKATDMTISDIADALNFPNSSSFCQYFKHETGYTPSDYRQNS